MSRYTRKKNEGGIYHMILRGINKQELSRITGISKSVIGRV